MSTKSSRHASASASAATSAAAPDTAEALLAPLNALSDVTRQQLTLMTEATCAVLGNSEAWSRIQQQAAHQASLRHQAAAQSLRGEVEPLDVLSIQSDLLRQDLQEVAQYWAQLASAAVKSQLDMVGRMTDAFNNALAGAPEAARRAAMH